MKFEKYLSMPNVEIPSDILTMLQTNHEISATEFKDKNDILSNINLQNEIGYIKMKSGNLLVSMTCPMPNVTADMINWWFWWHAQESVRYKLWYPNEHFGISYDKKQKAYFSTENFTKFEPNTHYPLEKVGKAVLPLKISFMNPNDFGFDEKLMNQNNVATVLCANVGAFKGLIEHTKMAHMFIKKDDGLFLVSRFWLGETLNNKVLRKAMLTDNMALDMAKHCYVEYRNLAIKLPQLYAEFNNN